MQTFDHEKRKIYLAAIEFVAWTSDVLGRLPKTSAVHAQFDRASTSVLLDSAQGNGKHTPDDRCRFFDIARGSALQRAACLDVLVAKAKIDRDVAALKKAMRVQIVSMIVGLVRSDSNHRDT